MSTLDDVADCPTAAQCEVCAAVDELCVGTVQTPVGVFCCTLCDGCVEDDRTPTVGWAAAAGRAMEHCGHLGIDADQMAALMADDDTVG